MLVVEDPATSSPGPGVPARHDRRRSARTAGGSTGWRCRATACKVVSGWEEAYTQDFSGSSGKGDRPIVVSYASSPAAELGDDGKPTHQGAAGHVLPPGRVRRRAERREGRRLRRRRCWTSCCRRSSRPRCPSRCTSTRHARASRCRRRGSRRRRSRPSPATLPPADIQQNRERWIDEWRGSSLPCADGLQPRGCRADLAGAAGFPRGLLRVAGGRDPAARASREGGVLDGPGARRHVAAGRVHRRAGGRGDRGGARGAGCRWRTCWPGPRCRAWVSCAW